MAIVLKKYLDLQNSPDEVVREFEKWSESSGHSNGYAKHWIVKKQEEAKYPVMNQYFLDQGLEVGETVIVHDEW